ncbi:MAG: hypothetical protein P4L27_15060 [Ignavibacteriaceae bacterium]|nr:hypothetical protein [Ignavibacteriaceae bacterium]
MAEKCQFITISVLFILWFFCPAQNLSWAQTEDQLVAKDTLINGQLIYHRSQWWIIAEKSELVWTLLCDENYYKKELEESRDKKVVFFGNLYIDKGGSSTFALRDSSEFVIGEVTSKTKLKNGILKIAEGYVVSKALFLDNKLIYQNNVSRLYLLNNFKIGGNDILIINEDDNAECCPGGYERIISINKDKKIFITGQFGGGGTTT